MKKIQLSIPTPCHENWENMTPVEKGRFCNSCQKQVVDFSSMSDREIAAFFKKPSTGSTCGRFLKDQLDRDIEIPRKRVPWVKYFFQFALPAFLISLKANAQKERPLIKEVMTIYNNPILRNVIPQTMEEPIVEDSIRGKVMDPKGNPIPFASVVIKGTKIAARTNANGEFAFHSKGNKKEITIVISAVGFESKEVSIVPDFYFRNNLSINLTITQATLGEVVVVGGYVSCKRIKPKKTDTISAVSKIQEIEKLDDKSLNPFKLYPNPIQSGSLLNMEWKKSETGYFIFQLIDQSGQTLFNKEMWIDDKAPLLNIQLPQVVAGNYIVRMTSKQSQKSFSQEIIIQ